MQNMTVPKNWGDWSREDRERYKEIWEHVSEGGRGYLLQKCEKIPADERGEFLSGILAIDLGSEMKIVFGIMITLLVIILLIGIFGPK
jgi:hypothetical protein